MLSKLNKRIVTCIISLSVKLEENEIENLVNQNKYLSYLSTYQYHYQSCQCQLEIMFISLKRLHKIKMSFSTKYHTPLRLMNGLYTIYIENCKW